jgi:hypothetical protein
MRAKRPVRGGMKVRAYPRRGFCSGTVSASRIAAQGLMRRISLRGLSSLRARRFSHCQLYLAA